MKFLDFNGLQYLINKIKILLRGYEQSNTVFNSDGSITTKTTMFTSNGVNETIS